MARPKISSPKRKKKEAAVIKPPRDIDLAIAEKWGQAPLYSITPQEVKGLLFSEKERTLTVFTGGENYLRYKNVSPNIIQKFRNVFVYPHCRSFAEIDVAIRMESIPDPKPEFDYDAAADTERQRIAAMRANYQK